MIYLQNAKIPIVKPISAADYYQVRRCYGEVSLDLASLTDFYLPLVGSDAFSVYLCLSRIATTTFVHSDLVGFVDLTLGQIENAIRKLEAVGLVRTFFQNEGNTRLFVYCLYAPLHANEFAKDIMLAGTLKGKIGIEGFDKLFARHAGQTALDDMEEVSASFPEVFRPSYDAKFYLSPSKQDSDAKASARTGFDKVAFLSLTEKLGLRKGGLSDAELYDIERIAALYHINESQMAEFVLGCIRSNAPIGKKLDRELLSRQAAGASPFRYLKQEEGESSGVKPVNNLSKKIQMMDQVAPAAFLTFRQGNHKPASADLKLIERLGMEIGLPDPCINALLDYVLATKDNQLPAAYCEKLAASLVREGCRSARDAMDYLTRSRRKKKKVGDEDPQPMEKAPVLAEKQDTEADENVSDEEVEAMLRQIYGGKK